MAFGPDVLVTAGPDLTLRLWDSAGTSLAEFRGHTENVYAMAYMTGSGAITFPLKPVSSDLAAVVFNDSRDNDAPVVLGSGANQSWIWNVSWID